ncbi:MAG: adenylate/guanylate cyclase domain-containing protein, partial [Alphaproteobacteria bacterium]|nr:adenylate/guanylate cyclase domain-containing protein [Alphaproteobacteria bacterium]
MPTPQKISFLAIEASLGWSEWPDFKGPGAPSQRYSLGKVPSSFDRLRMRIETRALMLSLSKHELPRPEFVEGRSLRAEPATTAALHAAVRGRARHCTKASEEIARVSAIMAGSQARGDSVQKRIRLWSGLVLLFYVATHLLNHSLGLASLDVLEGGRDVFIGFWRSWVGIVLLYGSLMAHLGLALWSLYQRRTLRVKPLEYAQVLLGLTVPFLMIEHVIGTRLLNILYGVQDNYYYIVLVLWVFVPWLGILQNIFLVIAWAHGVIGLHYWLKLKPWFPRFAPVFYGLALLLPVCAIVGFVAAGREISLLAQSQMWLDEMAMMIRLPNEEAVAVAKHWTVVGRYAMGGLIAAVLIARWVRLMIERTKRRVVLTYPNGRKVEIVPGMTVLEASREANIPHASVCGGRGRCSTCRVRCGPGAEHLPEPSAEEAKVLSRVGAPEGVRLACQIRPSQSLAITPLLPATTGPKAAWKQPPHMQGSEREICVMFADIRSFTRFSETKLPYDVVFVLNRYFRAMGDAIQGSGGQIDKFIGDGV